MAEAVEHTLRKALIAHEPEPATLPVVFRTSWRVFTSHLRFLLITAAATAAIPLLVVLALTAIFGPIVQPPTDQPFPWGPPNLDSHGRYSPAPAPHGHYAPAPAPTPPAPKVNPVAFAVATTVNFLLSAGAHVILIAVFVYVVLGDHVGRKPGPVWGVIKSSFFRLIGTDIAQSLVTILVTFVLGALVALIGGVVTGVFFKGEDLTTFWQSCIALIRHCSGNQSTTWTGFGMVAEPVIKDLFMQCCRIRSLRELNLGHTITVL